MIRMTVEEASGKLRELVDAVLRGEQVLLSVADGDGERQVQLVVADNKVSRHRTPGSARGLVWMSDDFDEPLEEFEAYMR